MRIIDLELITVRVNTRGDWLIVLLHTDEGFVGLGEASHGGFGPDRDRLTATVLQHQCLPRLRGRDPRHITACIEALWSLADGLPGATAVSACEQAIWDLAAQALGVPITHLLGGPARDTVPLYANINRGVARRVPEGFAEAAGAAVREGFTAVKLAPFDGIDQRRVREPEQRALVQLGIDCVRAVRDVVGPTIDIMVDCHSAFDLPTAILVARDLRDLGVTWFEEPLPVADLKRNLQLKPVVNELGMELVGGELLFGLGGFWPHLTAGVWDVIMPDIKHCGGFQAGFAIGQAARTAGVSVAPHNPSGPVSTVASAHLTAALPGARFLEVAWGEVDWRGDFLTPNEPISDGVLTLPTTPGLGVTLCTEPSAKSRQKKSSL